MSGEARVVLDELLLKCHQEHSVMFNDLMFHKHDSHHLGSLFYLGADGETLKEQTETSIKKDSDPEQESPHKITVENWKAQSLGDKHFCKSYRLFFDEQLHVQDANFDWKTKIIELLKEEVNPGSPFINGLVAGLVHPLISLGYAYELNSAVVGSEALTLTAVCYNYLHETLDHLSIPKGTKNPYDILAQMRTMTEFSDITKPGVSNMEKDVKKHLPTVLSLFQSWDFAQFSSVEYLFDFSVYLFAATHKPNQPAFDFFLLHVLTGLNAIRTLLKVAPEHFSPLKDTLLSHWFFLTIIIYFEQLRPEINKSLVEEYDLNSGAKTWGYVDSKVLETKLKEDAHVVKVVRALIDARSQWGDKNHFYLKAAALFVDQIPPGEMFVGGESDKATLNIVNQ